MVFDGTKNNAVITVENKDQNSNIVQSWLSVVDAASPAKDAFIITPPLFRLKAGEKGFVRVVRSGKKLPDDRESMFWLNIKIVMPTKPDEKARELWQQLAAAEASFDPRKTWGKA
ncbi:hypothetical protein SM68_04514 [Klebsiella pneumoniae]|nr:hypothetical protein SM68_04514 [Klebsiella pneumoniae]